MQLPARSLERSLRYGLGAEVPSYLCGIHGAYAQKAFSCQVLLLHEGEHVWSGLQPTRARVRVALDGIPGVVLMPGPSVRLCQLTRWGRVCTALTASLRGLSLPDRVCRFVFDVF